MHYAQITEELKKVSFDFFYWFSRFEYLIKAQRLLKSEKIGDIAEPDWDKFVNKYKDKYHITDEANKLINLHPKKQVVSRGDEFAWKPTGIAHCNNDLCKVVAMLRTLRNNLFHSGKHGDREVDDIERNKQLLKLGKIILDDLADRFDISGDYERVY